MWNPTLVEPWHLVKDAFANDSTKQKSNTKSSPELEHAEVSDIAPQVTWTRHFLHVQGHGSNDTTVCQDNTSAISLKKNGKLSSGKQTRHINIQHFFVTDRISDDELDAEHCLTNDMIGDFLH